MVVLKDTASHIVHFPPPSRSIAPKFVTLGGNDILIRIFDPTKYDTTAISFRNYGPISRFDHHRECPQNAVRPRVLKDTASHIGERLKTKGLPACTRTKTIDPDRSVLYAGRTLSCCIVEIFGTGGVVKFGRQQVAFITLKDTLMLLDLRGSAAMAAGTVAALSSITEREISQAWGKYFNEHPELYGMVDGLIFSGAHNGEDALVLYERAKVKLTSAKIEILPLNHPDLRDTILHIANNHSLLVRE
jgi:RES domain